MFMSFFFFKQKTAYEMRISDWSSDVCSSDLPEPLSRYQIGRYLARAARKHANQRNMATVAGRCEGLRQRACTADFDDVVDTPGQIIGNLTPLRGGFVIDEMVRTERFQLLELRVA